MFSYLDILRPGNCLMSVIAVIIGALIVAGNITFFLSESIWLIIAIVFVITGAGNAVNDYIDMEADKINKPNRPVPSGKIYPKSALIYSLVLFAIGIILSGFVNYIVLIIAIINSLILIAYSLKLQHKLLLGNISVSYLTASLFIFGAAAITSDISALAAPALFALLAFLATMSREILKDIEDFEGDRQSLLKRAAKQIKEAVAERIGLETGELKHKKKLKILSMISLLLAILISPVPYFWNIFSVDYLYIVWITDVIFLWVIASTFKTKSSSEYKKLGKRIKMGMLIGLIAFLVGALL